MQSSPQAEFFLQHDKGKNCRQREKEPHNLFAHGKYIQTLNILNNLCDETAHRNEMKFASMTGHVWGVSITEQNWSVISGLACEREKKGWVLCEGSFEEC